MAHSSSSAASVSADKAARKPRQRRNQQRSETLVDRVATFIKRFVLFSNEELYNLVALWVISTHLTEVWDYTGYLFFYSSEPGSGKSRALEVLDLLVANSSGILISPSSSVLFRLANGQTQLMDEIDTWTHGEHLRSVLNAGFRKGATVPRMDQTDSGYEAKRFQVFGPRALAGLRLKSLETPTLDRTFAIEMKRQKKDERKEPLRLRKIKAEAEALRWAIKEWAKANQNRIAELYDQELDYLFDFKDRTIDITQPLATILETVYTDSRGVMRERLALVHAAAITRKEEETVAKDHDILRKLLQLTKKENPLVGTATELSSHCPGFSHNDVSATLRRYGFKTKSKRKNNLPKYRYELSAERLGDLVFRYIGNGANHA
jgi:hypothetical protein